MRLFRKLRDPKLGNYRLNLDPWFERSQKVDSSSRWPRTAFSPIQFAAFEIARRNLDQEGLDSVKVDYFAWSIGEPAKRSVTKVGGLPYRPRNLPWPYSSGSQPEPLDFVAQFNFADSTDLFPKLPGEVLLIFNKRETDEFITEWHNEGLENLVRQKDIPLVEESFPGQKMVRAPLFGNLWRTHEFPSLDKETAPSLRNRAVSKIGGMPDLISSRPTVPDKFLCKLCSVQIPIEFRWPFVNAKRCPKPLQEWSKAYNAVMIGDLGELYCFIDGQNQVTCFTQCF